MRGLGLVVDSLKLGPTHEHSYLQPYRIYTRTFDGDRGSKSLEEQKFWQRPSKKKKKNKTEQKKGNGRLTPKESRRKTKWRMQTRKPATSTQELAFFLFSVEVFIGTGERLYTIE